MLVTCPACGRKVSDRAPACPFCRANLAPEPSALPAPAAVSAPAPPPRSTAPLAPAPRPALAPLGPGDLIGEDYRVVRVLGEGGFGLVYLVYSSSSRQLLALKAIRPELARDPALRAMFEKEAQIWIDLERHPYLVRAHAVSEVHGELYLALEYVAPGEDGLNSLEAVLARRTPPLAQTLRWAVQFCHGMEHAYARGIRCHRDIKPANVLLGADRAVRISDFGIAGVLPAPAAGGAMGDGQQTAAGAVFGTATHMPPEQFVDAAGCDERSDIYSFGITLFQMVSGGLPFVPVVPPGPDRGLRTFRAFHELHSRAPLPPLDSPLFGVVRHCLEKDRERRFGSFRQLRAELEPLLRRTSGEVVTLPALAELDAWDLSVRGNSLGSLGRHQEALSWHERAVAAGPGIAGLHSNHGQALSALGRPAEALAAYERALQIDPGLARAWINKGLALARLGCLAEALPAFEKALSLEPTSADALIARGTVLGEVGRQDEELAAYERALQIDPRHPLAWMNRGIALVAAGQIDEGLESYGRCLELDPRNVAAWVGRGTCLGQSGRAVEALEAFDHAVALDPADPRAWYNRGNALLGLDRGADALSCFARATDLEPDGALAWYNRGLTEVRLGQNDAASRSLRRFLALARPDDPLRPPAERILGKLATGEQLRIGGIGELRTEGAGRLETVRRGSGPAPPPPSAPPASPPGIAARTVEEWSQAGAGLLREGRLAEALACGEQATAADRHHAPAWTLRASALHRLERSAEAIASYEQSLLCDPAQTEVWFLKASLELVAGSFGDSLTSYREFLAQAEQAQSRMLQLARDNVAELEDSGVKPRPRSATGWLRHGLWVGGEGKVSEALAAFDRAVELAPEQAAGWRLRGDALLDLGRAEEALHAYDAAIQRDATDARAWHGKAGCLGRLGDPARAVGCLDQAVRLAPGRPGPWSDRGKALLAIGRYEEAIESLQSALRLVPDHPAPWYNKALAEDALKRPAAAAASYRAFLERARPGMEKLVEQARQRLSALAAAGPVEAPAGQVDLQACLRQGGIRLNKREFEPALALFAAACAAEPASVPGWEGRGDCLVGLQRFGEAAACFEKAIGLQASPGLWRKRGLALEAAGRLEEALAGYDQALAVQQRDAGLWDLRAGVLLRLGRPEEALQALALALARDARHALARFHKAEAECALGRLVEAAVSYKQFLALAPAHLAAEVQQARARLQQLRPAGP